MNNNKYPQPPPNAIWQFIRTCQECGQHHKAIRPPEGPLSNAYANRECRKCGSEALDYGSEQWFTDTAALVKYLKIRE